ncbi:cobalamin biosynthesis protein CobD [Thiocapsa imhoffii]|uniref:Cobalamin biosynthesis protein CobD n=1 Tax=Thiocapsa imhoffii TaxID=382777 RepID=A0A9X0WH22_9GAMM|nr:adenosylcobinamide-phosphate synthase CbiB [Thiocapsa imhoffii]MBK1644566.1 cobalamin biosynthesis protein CobD [Thiocapsa imhoffii]
MELTLHLVIIAAAVVFDARFGDPVYRFHPVRLLGSWSLIWERWLFARGWSGFSGGVAHGFLVVAGALGAWWSIRWALGLLSPWFALFWDVFIAYSLLCTHDLLAHGLRVLAALDDLPRARAQLRMLVGRDTDDLDRGAIVRATIESLAENLTDGVLTPLWALCLFGLPGLILVKAVSTLDSMVGYQNERYARFGWAAARSDDLVHWLPARLSVPLIAAAAAILRLHPRLVWPSARDHHAMLPSPNSGWSEAACAGALRVRLVGPIRYAGRLVTESYMGDPSWPADLDARHLADALRLIRLTAVLALAVGLLLTPLRPLLPW